MRLEQPFDHFPQQQQQEGALGSTKTRDTAAWRLAGTAGQELASAARQPGYQFRQQYSPLGSTEIRLAARQPVSRILTKMKIITLKWNKLQKTILLRNNLSVKIKNNYFIRL